MRPDPNAPDEPVEISREHVLFLVKNLGPMTFGQIIKTYSNAKGDCELLHPGNESQVLYLGISAEARDVLRGLLRSGELAVDRYEMVDFVPQRG